MSYFDVWYRPVRYSQLRRTESPILKMPTPLRLTDYVNAAEAFVEFEEEFEEAEVHDEELAVSRPHSPAGLSVLSHDAIAFRNSSGKSATNGTHHLR